MDVLELADDAVRLASADARAARRLAGEALAAADDAETRSTAERALGLAAVELGDAAAAVEHFRRAIAIAEAAGLHAPRRRGADEPRARVDADRARARRRWPRPTAPSRIWKGRRGRGCRASGR